MPDRIDRDQLLTVMAQEAYDVAEPTDGQRDMASLMLHAAVRTILAQLRGYAARQAIGGWLRRDPHSERAGYDLYAFLDSIEEDLLGDADA